MTWNPVVAGVNSGNKYVTGKGLDDKDADAWDYALGWLDLLPDGVEIKLAAKYTVTTSAAIIICCYALRISSC